FFFFFQAEDGIRDFHVTGVQTCALPIYICAFIPLVIYPSPADARRAYQSYSDTDSQVKPKPKPMVAPKPANSRKPATPPKPAKRSEERRVGKESRSGRARKQ